jgi:hypothetical protein
MKVTDVLGLEAPARGEPLQQPWHEMRDEF